MSRQSNALFLKDIKIAFGHVAFPSLGILVLQLSQGYDIL